MENLVNEILVRVLSVGVDDVGKLKEELTTLLGDYSIYKLETTLPATQNGEATLYLFKQFSKSKINQGMNKKTLNQYWIAIKGLCAYTNKEINMCTYEDINSYLLYYRSTGVCPNTIKNKRLLLSSVFTYLFNNRYIAENPMIMVDRIKAEPKLKTPLTQAEVEKIRIACEGHKGNAKERDSAIFEFLLGTGVRVSELCSIKLGDINFDEKYVNIIGKGNKPRKVWIKDSVMVRVKDYLRTRQINVNNSYNPNAPLFTKLYSNSNIGVDGVETLLKKIGTESKCPRLHPHLTRATFCTNLIEKGVPLTVCAELMGHSSVATTEIYIKMTNETKKRFVEAVS